MESYLPWLAMFLKCLLKEGKGRLYPNDDLGDEFHYLLWCNYFLIGQTSFVEVLLLMDGQFCLNCEQ